MLPLDKVVWTLLCNIFFFERSMVKNNLNFETFVKTFIFKYYFETMKIVVFVIADYFLTKLRYLIKLKAVLTEMENIKLIVSQK